MIDYNNIGLPHAKEVNQLSCDIAHDLALRALGLIVLQYRFGSSVQISNRDLNDMMRTIGSDKYQVSTSVTDERIQRALKDKGYAVTCIDKCTIEVEGW